MPIAGKSMEKQERKHGSWLIGGLVALAAIAVVLLAVVVGPDLVEPELSPEKWPKSGSSPTWMLLESR